MSLKEWFGKGPKGDWVDIGAPKKKGKYQACGRKSAKGDSKRAYPKCVPRAKANRMTESERRSAVSRKRSKAQGVGGKPTNVATFKKRKKAADGGYMGSFIDVQIPEGKGTSRRIGNPSVRNYYKSLGII